MKTSKFQIAVRQAEALGHTMVESPPGLDTGVRRKRCTRCDGAVLGYENGTTWGSALNKPCPLTEKP